MAYINVYDWKSDQVIEWLKGELSDVFENSTEIPLLVQDWTV